MRCPFTGLTLAPYRVLGYANWLSRDPLPNAELLQGPNLYRYVANNPINLVDWSGLCDFFFIIDLDFVPILGIDINFGFKLDFDDVWNSGQFFTFGLAGGGSLGAAFGAGYAARDIEGSSLNFDANYKAVSGNLAFDDVGLNAVTITVGPGGGAMSSVTQTSTLSPRTIINLFK